MMNSDTDGDNREQGIEFGALYEHLDAYEYPTTAEKLIEKYGNEEIGLPKGTSTLREVLAPLREPPDGGSKTEAQPVSYESAEQVRQAIFNLVDSDAVGREGYADRDPPAIGEEREGDQQSL